MKNSQLVLFFNLFYYFISILHLFRNSRRLVILPKIYRNNFFSSFFSVLSMTVGIIENTIRFTRIFGNLWNNMCTFFLVSTYTFTNEKNTADNVFLSRITLNDVKSNRKILKEIRFSHFFPSLICVYSHNVCSKQAFTMTAPF